MPRTVKYAIAALFVIRTAVSLAISDGRLTSDSITYFGAVVNLSLNGSISSIQPEDGERFSDGADPGELYDHLAGLHNPLYRPLPYQWLHAAIYAPILFFWKSLTPVILINNLLFFGAGMLFFRAVARNASAIALIAGWAAYAFFPSFYTLTSNFYSEPLFLLLLGVIVLLIDKLGLEQFYLLFISAAAISLTRPFGIVLVAALVMYSALRNHYARAAGLSCAAVLAFLINAIVMSHAVPENARTFSVSAAETLYSSSAAGGNPDDAAYFVFMPAADRDSAFARYKSGSLSGAALANEAIGRNLHTPGRFLKNSFYKVTNYFFGVAPATPASMPVHQQTPSKKFWWIGGNLLLFALAWAGLMRAPKHAAQLFLFIFSVGLVFHFLLLSRYRYFLPILAFATAYIPIAADHLLMRSRNMPESDTR
jgi:hypothetical protein